MKPTSKILAALLVTTAIATATPSYAVTTLQAVTTAAAAATAQVTKDTTALNTAQTAYNTSKTKVDTTLKTLTTAQGNFDKSCGASVAAKAKTCATTLLTALNNAKIAKENANKDLVTKTGNLETAKANLGKSKSIATQAAADKKVETAIDTYMKARQANMTSTLAVMKRTMTATAAAEYVKATFESPTALADMQKEINKIALNSYAYANAVIPEKYLPKVAPPVVQTPAQQAAFAAAVSAAVAAAKPVSVTIVTPTPSTSPVKPVAAVVSTPTVTYKTGSTIVKSETLSQSAPIAMVRSAAVFNAALEAAVAQQNAELAAFNNSFGSIQNDSVWAERDQFCRDTDEISPTNSIYAHCMGQEVVMQEDCVDGAQGPTGATGPKGSSGSDMDIKLGVITNGDKRIHEVADLARKKIADLGLTTNIQKAGALVDATKAVYGGYNKGVLKVANQIDELNKKNLPIPKELQDKFEKHNELPMELKDLKKGTGVCRHLNAAVAAAGDELGLKLNPVEAGHFRGEGDKVYDHAYLEMSDGKGRKVIVDASSQKGGSVKPVTRTSRGIDWVGPGEAYNYPH